MYVVEEKCTFEYKINVIEFDKRGHLCAFTEFSTLTVHNLETIAAMDMNIGA